MACVSPTRKFFLLSRFVGGSAAARRLGVAVGQRCRIYSCNVASEHWLLSIGNDVTVSSDVLFITHDGTGSLFVDDRGRRFRYAPISVGSRSFIGARATILPGVKIGDDCVVAAGSVVSKSVPNGSVVAGNPARFITDTVELRERGLAWPAKSDRHGSTYRKQVDSIAETNFRFEIARPKGVNQDDAT